MAVIEQDVNDKWAVYNSDCIEVMESMPDDKIHLSIYSPPFGGLYTYSSSERDISNCLNVDEFFEHYEYCIKQMERVTMPGRINAVHCTEFALTNTGKDSLFDLPGHIIRLHVANGFDYIARCTIWKEPLWIRRRTLAKDLFHKTICEDGVNGGIARGDYILFFRKKGNNPTPVIHPVGLTDYAGESEVPQSVWGYRRWEGDQTKNQYSHWIWRQYASCIWDDIRMGNVLPFRDCKEDDDEKHVHPLYLDAIERIVQLRSNPGETVFTPFMGIGSAVYGAVKLGRKGMGVELKPSYYRQALANLNALKDQPRAEEGMLPLEEMEA
jgi:DNA modification methylase